MKHTYSKLVISVALALGGASAANANNYETNFNRIASFPVCSQIDSTCNTDEETAAEIVAAGPFGHKLIYTDSPQNAVGFINISNPDSPMARGTTALEGEPTSVAMKGIFALVGVNTSEDFINVSGHLAVVNHLTQEVVHTIDLGGQPDSVAVSPDKKYAAVVIENERDEDLGNGEPPQLPAGELVVVDISNKNFAKWTTKKVDLTGLSDLFPGDPEPEYVDINEKNIAVVTLQENNYIVLVNLEKGEVIRHFSAGSVDLNNVDATEEDPALIKQVESLTNVPREPDGVAWINNKYFATADEGDLVGGSRGFTIFKKNGKVVYSSGSDLDQLTARLGHYPDGRSENKGNEPENVVVGKFGKDTLLFVNSERSSLVFVYNVNNPKKPKLEQILPTGAAPEGGLAIPRRNLLVVASEEDARDDKIRSVVNIYKRQYKSSSYPTLVSANDMYGLPIPWGAMSGLSADTSNADTLYAVEDSFYASNRIFKIDVGQTPAVLTKATTIKDSGGIFAGIATSGATEDPDSFDDVDLAAMINDDGTVNIDPEGLAQSADGGFWIASEGAGTIGDTEDRPIEKLNFLFKTDPDGVIEDVITLPQEVNDIQVRFGFEGVAEYNGKAYVTFQRAWGGESGPRIGIYDTNSGEWRFVFYPLDAVESQNGGWVGLSDISSLGNGKFLVVERDNQGGPDAAIKRLYKIDLNFAADGDTITKEFVRDLVPDLKKPGGLVYEKIEGSAVTLNGDVYIINDNDGVDDNSGETQLINLGKILD